MSVIRIRLISLGIFLFAMILVGKLYMLQIVDHQIYSDKADRQYSSSGTLFNRGSIFFQNKDGTLVSAATLKSGFIVAVNPEALLNPDATYSALNPILPVDRDFFIAKATKENDTYEEIARRVDQETGKKISALGIRGLSVYKDRWRFYPGGQTAAATVGLLGYKGDEYAGRYGLERQYEGMLDRTDDAYANFFAQIFAGLKSASASTTASEADIVTSIEPTVQTVLESELASTSAKWNPDSIGAIIMNPKNGEIYAMATLPTFDPNDPSSVKDVSVFSNPLIEDSYEMGSIIKPLTVAAGINEGLITASSTYYDAGFVMVNGRRIGNFDTKVRGTTTIQNALSHSLNVGMAHIEKLLGNNRFTAYFKAFGIGSKTGIDLPNEGAGLAGGLDSPRDIEHVTASFGQGISLTPIGAVRALSAVANGGFLVTPHVVKRIDYKIGFSKIPDLPTPRQILKSSTSEDVARMMTYSVDHVLLDGAKKIPGYSVAAKTGTAQIAKVGGGGYSDTDFLHSFVGFFPSYDPKFIVFFYMVKPKGAQFGSETLTVPFMNMVNFLINYYEVPPDR